MIAGPTASGKSALAVAVASRDDGIVINADASQVYSGLRVLTARPTPDEEARVPHALYGHVPRSAPYSVGHWLRDLGPVLADAERSEQRPVIVGGTGLYLTALTEGLAPIPPVPSEVRAVSERRDVGALCAELAARDPETHAVIDRRNPARIRRAWEVLEATGAGLAEWRRAAAPALVPSEHAVRLVVCPPTPALNQRIAGRFATMLDAGALEECRALLAEGLDPRWPSSKALGAPQLIAHLRGELTLGEAAEAAVTATRRFAKRQRTWFRNRMPDWQWHAPEPAATAALLAAVPQD